MRKYISSSILEQNNVNSMLLNHENRIIAKPSRKSVVLDKVEKLTFQDIHYFIPLLVLFCFLLY